MCTLNEAGRKSICASVRELRPIREGHRLEKSSKLRSANQLVVEGTPPLGERRETWECYESRSPKHFPNRGGRLKAGDRKSTRLNSSHQIISYAVFCLK